MKKGFSLIELLISLVIISIIVAVLTPIMTKKMSKSNMVVKVAQAKKGLQIYTNPGTYAFDVPENVDTIYLSGAAGGGGGAGATTTPTTKTFDTSTSTSAPWVVPMGVNSVTLTITGSGGGGGAANASANPTTVSLPLLTTTIYNDRCLSDEYMIIRGSDSDKDLCVTRKNMTPTDDTAAPPLYLNLHENCPAGESCCWRGTNEYCTNSSNGSSSGCNVVTCTNMGAHNICRYYKKQTSFANEQLYRRPNVAEFQKMLKYDSDFNINAGAQGLNFCAADTNIPAFTSCASGQKDLLTSLAKCSGYGGCTGGGSSDMCYPYAKWSEDGGRLDYFNSCDRYAGLGSNLVAAVRCARPLERYNGRFQGSGGAGGAKLEQKITVLPNDTFSITIGQGGTGGKLGTNSGNGAQGAQTTVVHKRGTTVLGTYYVKGGFGGIGASNTAHGTPSGNATPSGTCYSKNANTNCTTPSFFGAKGENNYGGAGGKVADTGSATSGGSYFNDNLRGAFQRYTTTELNIAKGQNATVAGFGGGGGYTPVWACEGSNCKAQAQVNLFEGGSGAKGQVTIYYEIILPGGGGGAGAAIGKTSTNINQEIEYKVTPSSRLVFTVGKGGYGGTVGQNGYSGYPTTFMEDEIIFNPGIGGGVNGIGGMGGKLVIKNSSKAKVLNANGITNPGQGGNGDSGKLVLSGQYQSYALDGGSGGTTFLGYFGGCGGGMKKDSNAQRNCNTQTTREGKSAAIHNAVKNDFGGSGGGGGGAIENNFEPGKGGDGSDGYLRIRWGEE